MKKPSSDIEKFSWIFVAATLVCASVGSWIRPGAESAGLHQYDYVLLPVIIIFMGIINKGLGFRLRAVLILVGHALFYVMVFLVFKNAGILMNIGEVSFAETLSWITPMFKATIMLSVISLVVDILLLRDIKKHDEEDSSDE